MRLTARDLALVPHDAFLGQGLLGGRVITSVSTDTRTIQKGSLFIALRGASFDGHAFIDEAVRRGAVAVIADVRAASGMRGSVVATLVVENTERAMGDLARIHRGKRKLSVLAIGGSNGKTTTKEMVAAVLRTRYRVLSTEGNLNNQIGVPLTLFRLENSHEVAVIELGTNHPGEIASLCRIAGPTHALLTNIGEEHLEFFGTVRGVATEEGALFGALAGVRGGTALVNADDRHVVNLACPAARKILYGFSSRTARVRGRQLRLNARGCGVFTFSEGSTRTRIELAVPGRHNAFNALAAAAVGIAFRVPARQIKGALESFAAVSRRMETVMVRGATVFNDAYNANPDSMRAALATLATVKAGGKRIAVLADMLELGDHSREAHHAIGEEVTRQGVDCLLTFGERARVIHDAARVPLRLHYEQKNMLAEYLAEFLSAGDLVLVKGSRGMHMEDVVVFLQHRLPDRGVAEGTD